MNNIKREIYRGRKGTCQAPLMLKCCAQFAKSNQSASKQNIWSITGINDQQQEKITMINKP